MTKKGFTLMELLVSIFITGMVMLALVAMWKTSSNHSAQAQRQSIIKNESTIFLRKVYSDFVMASEVLCPPTYPNGTICGGNVYIAVKEAVVDPDNTNKLVRITAPRCGSGNNSWGEENSAQSMISRCVKPSYVVYRFSNNMVYRCKHNFLDGGDTTMDISSLLSTATSTCSDTGNMEMIMPYVLNFSMVIPDRTDEGGAVVKSPDLLVDYTVRRDFQGDIPPVLFRFRRSLSRKRGV